MGNRSTDDNQGQGDTGTDREVEREAFHNGPGVFPKPWYFRPAERGCVKVRHDRIGRNGPGDTGTDREVEREAFHNGPGVFPKPWYFRPAERVCDKVRHDAFWRNAQVGLPCVRSRCQNFQRRVSSGLFPSGAAGREITLPREAVSAGLSAWSSSRWRWYRSCIGMKLSEKRNSCNRRSKPSE